ncbi:MAG: putative protein-disulfide isomerase [Psychromonas sp.]|jgi:putative protein-disulfide isomerase|uniref:DsbA family protein n=1 Tax=Psychromonas sp. TaxID=1884585 RepID=UPI0039E627D5
MVKVHYFYDPMCGWCYGATALLETLIASANIELIYHPGGMINRQTIAASFKEHILKNDQEIASQTGAVFAAPYKARLKNRENLVFDSYITTRAILVAEENGVTPLIMLKAIQKAHFEQGKQVELLATLEEIAVSFGLHKTRWQAQMQQAEPKVTEAVQASHRLMNQYKVQGYPSLIAETADGPQHLAHTAYYQNISAWNNLISTLN